MILPEELVPLAEKLRVYDVDQSGWEQENNGFESNVTHVLTHLAKDLGRKDFSDVDVIRGAIAPDSVQYALRLSRWSDVDVRSITTLSTKEESVRDVVETGLSRLPLGFPNFVGAVVVLSEYVHDLGHERLKEKALQGTQKTMRSVARQLIFSAAVQAYQNGFSITEAFDDRLAELRDRFDIPPPPVLAQTEL